MAVPHLLLQAAGTGPKAPQTGPAEENGWMDEMQLQSYLISLTRTFPLFSAQPIKHLHTKEDAVDVGPPFERLWFGSQGLCTSYRSKGKHKLLTCTFPVRI